MKGDGKPAVELAYLRHGRRRQAASEVENGKLHTQFCLHAVCECQHLADVPLHVVGAAHHAADVALKGRELEHLSLIHI